MNAGARDVENEVIHTLCQKLRGASLYKHFPAEHKYVLACCEDNESVTVTRGQPRDIHRLSPVTITRVEAAGFKKTSVETTRQDVPIIESFFVSPDTTISVSAFHLIGQPVYVVVTFIL